MQRSNNIHRKAKLAGTSQLWNKFKTMRNEVTTMLRNSKQLFFNRNVNTMDKKQFWKTMKYMRTEHSTIPTLVLNDSIATSGREKSSMLNAYFSDCFNWSLPPLNEADLPPEIVLCKANSGIADELLCTEEEVQTLQSIALEWYFSSFFQLCLSTNLLTRATPKTNVQHRCCPYGANS